MNTSATKADTYELITNAIVEALETAGDWKRPWQRLCGSQPVNVTGRDYRGVNTLALWVAMETNGWQAPIFGTFRQWQSVGAQVKKGSKGTAVVFWKVLGRDGESDEGGDEPAERKGVIARTFYVFNREQVENAPELPVPVVLPEQERLREVDQFISGTRAIIRHGSQDRAFYSVVSDVISLPEFRQFTSAQGYAATVLHELAHWSGHGSRCNRPILNKFGTEEYGREELVAEIASAMLSAKLGVEGEIMNHASYIKSWLAAIKADRKLLFSAASQAQKAVDYLFSLQTQSAQALAA